MLSVLTLSFNKKDYLKASSACLILLSLLLSSCGGGSSSGDGVVTTDGVDGTNGINSTLSDVQDKPVYYESDFLADSTLVLGETETVVVGIANAVSNGPHVIPFSIPQTGNYNFCIDGGDGVLYGQIRNLLNETVISIRPEHPLACENISIDAGAYNLFIDHPSAASIESFFGAPVPAVKLTVKAELQNYVDPANWLDEMNNEIVRAGGVPVSYAYPSLSRKCYRTPLSASSTAVFRQQDNQLLFSFRPNLSEGSEYLCTYFVPNMTAPTSAGDIGDIDTIINEYVNRSIVYSRPKAGEQAVSIYTDIKIEYDGVLDALPLNSVFTITPAVAGTFQNADSLFTFTPLSPLQQDVTYNVRLQNITDIDGNAKNDIAFSFTTEQVFDITSEPEALSDAQLCAIGVAESCVQPHYSTINSISAQVLPSATNGSRYLEVTTELNQPTPVDIVIDFKIVDTRTGSVSYSEKTIIEYSDAVTNTNLVELSIYDFETVTHNERVDIQVINAYNQTTDLGTWSVYNGEFFPSENEVVTTDNTLPVITNMFFSAGSTIRDRRFNVMLDEPTTEEINLEVSIDNDSGVCSDFMCLTSYDYYPSRIITIPAGTQHGYIEVRPLSNVLDPITEEIWPYTGDNYTSTVTATLTDARNAVIDPGLNIVEVITVP